MRLRHVAALCTALVAVALPFAAQTAPPPDAPADQYFGRLKLSFLGINNTFKDVTAEAQVRDDRTSATQIGRVNNAMNALNDWAHAYPNDRQLPRSYFLGEEALKQLYTKQMQEKAWSYMQLLTSKYKNTFFGKTVKAALARGFTAKYYAPAVACAADANADADAGSGSGDEPAAAPSPTAMPTSMPGPNNAYRVIVLTPPCTTPAPAPLPSSAVTVPPAGESSPGATSSPGVTSSPGASSSPGVAASPTAAAATAAPNAEPTVNASPAAGGSPAPGAPNPAPGSPASPTPGP